MSNTTAQSLYLTSSQWILTQSTKLSQIYTMESEYTQINLNDGKLEISWGKSKNTDFLEKYRPITDHFSENVCITDQTYLYRPSWHYCMTITQNLALDHNLI